MTDPRDTLYYHGRRSVDELMSALNAKSSAVALAHKQLSRLHLNRFVATMTATVDAIQGDPLPPAGTGRGDG